MKMLEEDWDFLLKKNWELIIKNGLKKIKKWLNIVKNKI